MSGGTIVMMVLVLGGIWGGFAYFVRETLRQEQRDRDAAADESA